MTDYKQTSYRLEQALLTLDRLAVKKILTESSFPEAPIEFLDKVTVPVLERLGKEWEDGRVALAQIYMSARILEDTLSLVLPSSELQRSTQPRLAIALLRDYHVLGKRIVTSALRASGFALADYGRIDVDELVARVLEDGIQILLISTLMLPSALTIREVKEKLEESRSGVKLAVGGAPFRLDRQLWKEVGADAMGSNASEAVNIVSDLARSLP